MLGEAAKLWGLELAAVVRHDRPVGRDEDRDRQPDDRPGLAHRAVRVVADRKLDARPGEELGGERLVVLDVDADHLEAAGITALEGGEQGQLLVAWVAPGGQEVQDDRLARTGGQRDRRTPMPYVVETKRHSGADGAADRPRSGPDEKSEEAGSEQAGGDEDVPAQPGRYGPGTVVAVVDRPPAVPRVVVVVGAVVLSPDAEPAVVGAVVGAVVAAATVTVPNI